MSINIPNSLLAYGSVSAAGAIVSGAGFASTNPAPGLYNLTLDNEVDEGECTVLVTPRGAVPLFVAVAQTSDSVKQVAVFTAGGAPVNGAFDFAVLRAPQT